MTTIALSPGALALSAILVVILALLSLRERLGIAQSLLISGLRTVAQLLVIGLVLKFLFDSGNAGLTLALAAVMFSVAGYEVGARQTSPVAGWWGVAIGTTSMVAASAGVTLFALVLVIQPAPRYTPQYLIPLLGMVLGNTMNGVAIAMERLTTVAKSDRANIEAQLMLGRPTREAIRPLRIQALRAGFIPIINGMAAAGIVSLPGMMTGQILAGNPPFEAAKYQILIMFLIAGGTGFGAIVSVELASRRLFDTRQRLRLDRLRA